MLWSKCNTTNSSKFKVTTNYDRKHLILPYSKKFYFTNTNQIKKQTFYTANWSNKEGSEAPMFIQI